MELKLQQKAIKRDKLMLLIVPYVIETSKERCVTVVRRAFNFTLWN